MGEVPLTVPEGLTEDAVSLLQIEHIDAFCNGKPFSIMEKSCDTCWYMGDGREIKMAYGDGLLARVLNDEVSSVELLHLPSGEVREYHANNRLISHVAVSRQLLALAVSSEIYMWDLESGECYSEVHSLHSSVISFSVVGQTLAVLCRWEHSDTDSDIHKIITWNLERGESHSFRLKPEICFQGATRLVITPRGDEVVLFRIETANRELRYYRYDLEGHLRGKTCIPEPSDSFRVLRLPYCSASRNNFLPIWCFLMSAPTPDWPPQHASMFFYDAVAHELKSLEYEIEPHQRKPWTIIRNRLISFCWKNVLYMTDDFQNQEEDSIPYIPDNVRFVESDPPPFQDNGFPVDDSDLSSEPSFQSDASADDSDASSNSSASRVNMSWIPPHPHATLEVYNQLGPLQFDKHSCRIVGKPIYDDQDDHLPTPFTRYYHDPYGEDNGYGSAAGLPSSLVLGDEIFLIRVYYGRFTVWCFDKHVDMPGSKKYRLFPDTSRRESVFSSPFSRDGLSKWRTLSPKE